MASTGTIVTTLPSLMNFTLPSLRAKSVKSRPHPTFAPVLFGIISQRWGVRGFEVGFAALGALLAAAAAMMSFSYFLLFYKYRVRG